MTKPSPPCKAEACAIQECLAASAYQQRACLPQIRALVRCCEGARQGKGEAEPPSCGGFSAELLAELERGTT